MVNSGWIRKASNVKTTNHSHFYSAWQSNINNKQFNSKQILLIDTNYIIIVSPYSQRRSNPCAPRLQLFEQHYIQHLLCEVVPNGDEVREVKLPLKPTKQGVGNTLDVNSWNDDIFCSDPLIPTWHSYILSEPLTFGRPNLHL